MAAPSQKQDCYLKKLKWQHHRKTKTVTLKSKIGGRHHRKIKHVTLKSKSGSTIAKEIMLLYCTLKSRSGRPLQNKACYLKRVEVVAPSHKKDCYLKK